MEGLDALLIKLQNTKVFNVVVVSGARDAAARLFPSGHDRLGRFKNIATVESVTDLLKIHATNASKKLVMLVDVTSLDSLFELEELIYSVHAGESGLLLGFAFNRLDEAVVERLISIGFDDVFELGTNNQRNHLRIYSWIRRFGGAPILAADIEKDAVAYLSNKKDKRIGRWTVLGSDMVAQDESGHRVKLTRQEVNFLTVLSEETDLASESSYAKLFKAPHAIVYKLKKKLGADLPIRHDSGGRYRLSK